METKVVNIKNFEGDYIPIHRGTKWGNPYKIGEDGSRSEVIEKYKEYVLASPILMASLGELKGKNLGCYCKPKACHGDILVELIENGTPD